MNLVAALLGAAATTPDRPALVGAGDPVSHGELAARAARACDLFATRVNLGDRVALLAGNEPAFVSAYLGTLAAGGAAVTPAAPPRARASLEIAAPPLVASAGTRDRARRAASRAATAPSVLVVDAEVSGAEEARPPVARGAEDLAVLLFTAGTAGPPKAAMLTHGSLLANLEQLQGHAGLRIEATDVALGVLPFFHVFGLNVVLDLALLAGASVALVDHFHPAEALARVRRDRVTVIAAVPAVYAAWSAISVDDAGDALSGALWSRRRAPFDGAADARASGRRARGWVDRSVARRDDERGRGAASPRVDRSAAPGRGRAARRHRGSRRPRR
jgi:long-chain acyl-CoA synthetase